MRALLSNRADLRLISRSPSGARLRTTLCSLTPATLSLRYLSTHLRHRMQPSRLPIEICEHVIDACYRDLWTRLHGYTKRPIEVGARQPSSATFGSGPRTQLNLFRDIHIRSTSHLDLSPTHHSLWRTAFLEFASLRAEANISRLLDCSIPGPNC